MRILFDQGTPVPLRPLLVGHTVDTAYERGWSTLANGDLLNAAEAASYDVFITTDQKLPRQQNLAERRLAILVLPTTAWPEIQRHGAAIVAAVAAVQPGECRDLNW
jgi:hypothetical protein